MKPEFITFTGLDEKTDFDMVRAISNLYPVEWGVLFSEKRQGREPRYPSVETIDRIRDQLVGEVRLAAHLCGSYAARAMARMDIKLDLTGFSRAQINTIVPDAEAAAMLGEKHGVRTILQHRTLRFPDDPRCDWLFDKSGGRGEAPASWPVHPEDGLYGYAGGMGPENVAETVERINAKGPYWIDMESRIRTNDWLDLRKCFEVCEKVYG